MIETLDDPLSAQARRRHNLELSEEWSLRGPLPMVQFGTLSPDTPPIPSAVQMSIEFEFENSNFAVMKPKIQAKGVTDVSIRMDINEFKLFICMKVLADNVPRNRFSHMVLFRILQAEQ